MSVCECEYKCFFFFLQIKHDENSLIKIYKQIFWDFSERIFRSIKLFICSHFLISQFSLTLYIYMYRYIHIYFVLILYPTATDMYYCLFFLPFVEHKFSIKKLKRKKSQNNT